MNQIRPSDVVSLYKRFGDARLLDMLPAADPDDDEYLAFLRQVADENVERGWRALLVILAMDPDGSREEVADFLARRSAEVEAWDERASIYEALARLGGEGPSRVLADSLLEDPVTESREEILRTSMEEGRCDETIVAAAIALAEGGGRPHRPATPSRMQDQWEMYLRDFLTSVADDADCEEDIRRLAQRGLELLVPRRAR